MDDEEILELENKKDNENSNKSGAIDKARNAKNTVENGQKIANKVAQKTSKETVKKAAEGAAKSFSKISQVASKLLPILSTVGVILLVLFIIIGILVFILTGLGLVLSGLESIASSIGNEIYNLFYGKATNISDEKIVETMEYLEDLGYDLYGYGFISKEANDAFTNEANKNTGDVADRLVTEYSFGNFFKNWFDVSNTVEQADYRNILAYITADNYSRLIKNKETDIKDKINDCLKQMIPLYGMIDRIIPDDSDIDAPRTFKCVYAKG